MSTFDNTALVRKYMELVAASDIDSALDLAADDATFWHPMSGTVGKEALREQFKQLGTLMRSFSSQVITTTAEADRVSVEVEAQAEFSNGRHYQNQYHFMFVVRDGKIQASREYVDSAPVKAAFF
ncbi:nuclear transport factor 2 family protein [Pseudomonas sp. 13B_2.1_Bac1]|uniref:nuclear transport factor 2 family protein n=1 Tax=Pseudomonas sp. 13B_2.1_Bac1 TaxID=2971624 RepID=UPI0021C7B16A|nr:nuclear transport factor 2 family protein [Pseudomonas sp. 13B_2.1_Bac1]MCU1785203.1 nuclear transport factor 2 family protein [Pseudomonas sp. 13B_2.1_Bac1]